MLAAIQVLGGVAQGSGWSLSTPNSVVFNSAPGASVVIGASFTYAFQCRFDAKAFTTCSSPFRGKVTPTRWPGRSAWSALAAS